MRRCDQIFFFFQAEDGIRDIGVTGVQTCALPISSPCLSFVPGAKVSATSVPLFEVLRILTRCASILFIFMYSHRDRDDICSYCFFRFPSRYMFPIIESIEINVYLLSTHAFFLLTL